jgi:A/G-specific adenine glycosylase
MSEFSSRLIAWHAGHGRHDLPWQQTRDPYRVWLSEIMLQQTQVETVIPYYQRFLQRFPDVASLAAAPLDDVLALWAGLGYYARARNLHRAAQQVCGELAGRFPQTSLELAELPGIGRSTAAAIASFCFAEPAAILDGNVKRVLCRYFGIEGFPGERAVELRLWELAESLQPQNGEEAIRVYPQAQMDLGATICTRSKPACLHCPLSADCVARLEGREADLPVARPKKVIPLRESDVLMLRTEDAVLLEQRPASGIWGGLYSLPQIEAGESAGQASLRYLGTVLEGFVLQPVLRHSFTHFTLNIRPWRLNLPAVPQGVNAPGLRWTRFDELAEVGLPAPIRKLLEYPTD